MIANPRFSAVPFSDPARASVNLSLIEKRLPPRLLAALPTLLAQLPAPDGALNYLERYLLCDDARGLEDALHYMTRHPAALHYALVIFSYSRYLSETLVQQPDLVPWLHRPGKSRQFKRGIEHVKSQEDLEEDFARFEATALDLEPSVLLARFKRREYLRITVRDLLGLATLTETTLELSELADVLLARALRMAEAKLAPLYGTPQTFGAEGATAAAARLTIFSLGKLGARELNYSSDIDLICLYTGDGETTGGSGGKLTNAEYFIRLAHGILKLVSEVTPEGAVYRIDMRLRPRGAEGFLASSLASARDYYRTAAREWELQMLIKARPSAGDIAAGRAFLRELQPLIFTPQFNIAAVEAVLNARQEMTRSLSRRSARAAPSTTESTHDAAWNVKLTPGGIRDIEFLAQCLQRLYGGGDPWLAAPTASATLVALQRLHDKGHLSGRDFSQLAAAYQFLRKVEHRLQLREGLQRHTLPDAASSAPGAIDRLARRCGIEAAPGGASGEELQRRIAQHFAEVREIYQRILVQHRPAEPAPEPAQSAFAGSESRALMIRLHRDFPGVAHVVASVSADALARRGLHRYLSAAIHEAATMAQLNAHPAWLVRAAELFERSDLAVDVFARQPADISLLDSAGSVLHGAGNGRESSSLPEAQRKQQISPLGDESPSVEMTGEGVFSRPAGAPFSDLSALRRNYRLQSTRVVVQSLLAAPAPGAAEPAQIVFEAMRAQSTLAAQAIDVSLPFVAQDLADPALASFTNAASLHDAPFVVLALGRLGTSEFDIGSDADLVFIADEALAPDAREPWRRLAERLIHTVSSHTRDGLLFPVDTRLRPRGQESDIVLSAAYLREYLQREALAWEAVSWLKAVPVAGNAALGLAVIQQAHSILRERWSAGGASALASELAQLRARLEKEGTGPQSRTEFKHIRGGFFDIEYLLGLLCFRAAEHAPPQTLLFPASANVLEQIAALQQAAALRPEAAATLRTAASLFRAVDHAHRLITGRAANRTPEPALAERIARLLVQWQFPLGAATAGALETAIAEVRAESRRIYGQIFGSE